MNNIAKFDSEAPSKLPGSPLNSLCATNGPVTRSKIEPDDIWELCELLARLRMLHNVDSNRSQSHPEAQQAVRTPGLMRFKNTHETSGSR